MIPATILRRGDEDVSEEIIIHAFLIGENPAIVYHGKDRILRVEKLSNLRVRSETTLSRVAVPQGRVLS